MNAPLAEMLRYNQWANLTLRSLRHANDFLTSSWMRDVLVSPARSACS